MLNGPCDQDLYLNTNIMDCRHDFFGLKVKWMDIYYHLDAKNWS